MLACDNCPIVHQGRRKMAHEVIHRLLSSSRVLRHQIISVLAPLLSVIALSIEHCVFLLQNQSRTQRSEIV